MQNWDSNLWMKQFNEAINAISYSPDGLVIAVGTGHDIHLLVASSWLAANYSLRGYSNKVTSIAFSGGGKHIAPGSWDKTVRIWDLMSGQAVG